MTALDELLKIDGVVANSPNDVDSVFKYPKKSPRVEGEPFALVKRHEKVRRAGYLGNSNNQNWAAAAREGKPNTLRKSKKRR